jgi:predicted nucleic acid-binding protein
MRKLRIYLDNCCYNRPFDDQRDVNNRNETRAKLTIQQMIRDGQLELVWSDVVDYENNDNPFEERRVKIAEWKALAAVDSAMNDAIQQKASELMRLGLRQKDAAHIASAIFGNADCFLTVDMKILNKPVRDIEVLNPLVFLRRILP